jgi:hypothetical protein|tara:strand:+ start:616 stop:792 length:177 start_codon:yes stop_codon:yes gene_type:complete
LVKDSSKITVRLPHDLEQVLREKALDERTTITYVMISCLRDKFGLPAEDELGDGSLLG